MKVFVLIVIISGNISVGSIHSVSAEFNSIESCQRAASSIVEQSQKREGPQAVIHVRSWGCYEK